MDRVAKFELISLKEFQKNFSNDASKIYTKLKIPQRATKYSAGYDFFSPFDFNLEPNKSIIIPTGIRVNMQNDYFLLICVRSGLGFKYKIQLSNTIAIIDADYYFSDNEGHIFVKLFNDNNENETLIIKQGQPIVQGIFMKYGITQDDNVDVIRNGGFGSTG